MSAHGQAQDTAPASLAYFLFHPIDRLATTPQPQLWVVTNIATTARKVLLLIIDALGSRVVRPAVEAGRLPTLRSFMDAGYVNWNSTSIFPSITPAATAALVTGGYPRETGVSGASFYDIDQDRVHYYGDDISAVMRRGFANYFEDFLVRLNRDQLRMDTVYETIEKYGGQAACLNFLWYRGEVEHAARTPWPLRLWPGVPASKTVRGPTYLGLGDFVGSRLPHDGPILRGRGGLFRRFGFTDVATGDQLMLMAENDALPDFTLAYFPDNDFTSHEKGPTAALATVESVDNVLAKVFAALGGLNVLLKSTAIILTGDHSQSDLEHRKDSIGIELAEVLDEYSVVPAGQEWRGGDELMICPNMRAAQVYLRADYWSRRIDILRRLVEDVRIDQVIWRAAERRYVVLTRDRGQLEFELSSDSSGDRDEYGAMWKWQGELAALAVHVNDGTLEFTQYPNAFERIAASFDDRVTGDIWVTSRLGYEFQVTGTKVNRRGSHGSLHVDDSASPLVIAGCSKELLPKSVPRGVDITPLCLSILGLRPRTTVGASHAISSALERQILEAR